MIRYLLVFFLCSLSSMFSQTSDRFTIKNIGINTTSNEFGTVVSKSGGIYYLKSGFKGQIDLDESSANLYRGEISDRGEITKGIKLPTDAIHAVFTNDGQYVYFYKKVGSKFQLFKAFIDNTGRWKDEIRLPFNDLNFNFKQPALSIDNTKLFFVSDKSDSNGSTDIYYVDIKNKGLEYGEPVHLSFYVNSPGEEILPYIGENDKIYFSSDGMGGEGGQDIYESSLSNGQYEKTANLGVPINSEFDDFAYTLTSGNSKGYFSSNRQGGKGGVDIYYFEDKKPTLNNCSQSISGFVKSKDNQKPIFEAIVEVFDSNGNSENTLTDEQGQFVFENIECEASIDIVAYKESYNGFAEAHIIPKKSNVINLFLNPEFPEGFKEEFDLSNEMVAIDTKTNEVIIPEKNKPADKKTIPIEKEESNKVAINEPKIEKKVVEEYYDPLDYDPYSQPQKATPKKVVEDEPKKKVIAKKEDIDPLDYDPYSQSPKKREVVITKNTEIDADSKPQKKVVADYDPLDYDPKTQSKNSPKQKAQEVDQIEEAKKKTELAQLERQKRIAEAKATADKLKIAEDAKNAEIAQQEIQQKAEVESQKQAQAQAIADAKKRDEQPLQEKESIAKASIEKAKQDEADRIKKEADDKARIEKERQDKLLAQQKVLEEERQKRIAEAKATADKLKIAEDAKNAEIAQQEIQQKAEVESQKQAQAQAIADAKKRDEQQLQEKESIAKASIEKAKQVEADRIKKESDDKARIEKERQDKLLAQQKVLEEERQKRIAEAKATTDKLKIAEDAKNAEIAQQEIQQKAEVESQKQAQAQAIADAKKRDEQQLQEKESIAKASIEKAKQVEADRIKKESDDKARIEKERQDKLLAQQKVLEEERQKRIAEAKATTDKLKIAEDAKNAEIAQQEIQQKAEVESQKQAQAQAIADAKKRDEQPLQEKESIAKASIEKAKQVEADRIKKESDDKARIEKERQDKLLAQQKVLEEERQKRIAEAKATADKLKIAEDAKNVEIAQQEIQQKAEVESQKQAQVQAIADAKKRDEQQLQEKESIAKASIEKAKQVEADRIKKESDDKARIEKERQDKLLAQQKVLEEERQKRIAEAKATTDKLKIAEDAKNAEIAQQEIQQKAEVESQKQAQAQAQADAKKRDEQPLQEKESIAKARIEKAKQVEADRIKKESDDKARIEKERQDKLLAQQKVLEEERQKRIAEAKATADKLKIAEDAKNAEIAQQEIQQKAEVESQKQAQAQAIADAKKRDEQPLQEKESIAKASIEKAKQDEADRIKKEADDKARIEKERQDKLLAQQKVLEEERQKRIAEAKATADKLKIAEDAKNAEIAQQEIISNIRISDKIINGSTNVSSAKQLQINKVIDSYTTLLKEKELAIKQIEENQIINEVETKNTAEDKVCAKNVNGNVLNSKTREALSNVTIDMYYDGQNIETTSTDKNGNFNFYNVDCNTKYILICYREYYDNIAQAEIFTEENIKDISILLEPNQSKNPVAINPKNEDLIYKQVAESNNISKSAKNEDDEMTYYIKPKEIEAPKVKAGKVVLNPIYFDLDEWYLTSEARRELDKIIVLMKMNPTMIVESGSHTDTRGRFEYNLELSEKRSQETVGYLVANGVDPDRISGRGYGETMPVNNCLDGVKCSEADHMNNRRTEFVILKY